MKITVRLVRKIFQYLLDELPKDNYYIELNGFVCSWFIDRLEGIYPMTSTVAERNKMIDELKAIKKIISEVKNG